MFVTAFNIKLVLPSGPTQVVPPHDEYFMGRLPAVDSVPLLEFSSMLRPKCIRSRPTYLRKWSQI